MLVVMGIDAGMDLSSPTMCLFTWIDDIGVQNSGQLQLKLDVPICMERPVTIVKYVFCREGTSNSRNLLL